MHQSVLQWSKVDGILNCKICLKQVFKLQNIWNCGVSTEKFVR